MSLADVLERVTSSAARAIGRPEFGRLEVGLPGDAAILDVEEGAFPFQDSTGQSMNGTKRFTSRRMVIAGNRIEQAG
jgi:dihydroorotase